MTSLRREGEWPGRVVLRRLLMRAELRPWDDDADAVGLRLGFASEAFVDKCVEAGLGLASTVRSPAVPGDEFDRWEARGFHPELELMVMESRLSATPEIETEPLIHHQVGSLVDVDNAAFEKPWRVGRLGLEDARSTTPWAQTLAITEDGEVAAFAIVGADRHRVAYLQRIATAPRWQGRGLGSRLLTATRSWAVERGCERLLLNVRPDATRVIDFYLTHHFEPDVMTLRVFRRDKVER